MVYRKGAFDHYDTIFCAAPQSYVKEIRAMEIEFNLRPKRLVEHGYGRLDTILSQARHHHVKQTPAGTGRHILIAPSWGSEGMIESGICESIVGQLLRRQYRVMLRPHPQTLKFAGDKVDAILTQHEGNPLFTHELNVVGQDSLHDSDVMISDWSGVALEYMLALKKPVLFVDVPMKVNNPEYNRIAMEPLECRIRKTKRSDILELHEINRVTEKLEGLLKQSAITGSEPDNMVFNPGESGDYESQVLASNPVRSGIRQGVRLMRSVISNHLYVAVTASISLLVVPCAVLFVTNSSEFIIPLFELSVFLLKVGVVFFVVILRNDYPGRQSKSSAGYQFAFFSRPCQYHSILFVKRFPQRPGWSESLPFQHNANCRRFNHLWLHRGSHIRVQTQGI